MSLKPSWRHFSWGHTYRRDVCADTVAPHIWWPFNLLWKCVLFNEPVPSLCSKCVYLYFPFLYLKKYHDLTYLQCLYNILKQKKKNLHFQWENALYFISLVFVLLSKRFFLLYLPILLLIFSFLISHLFNFKYLFQNLCFFFKTSYSCFRNAISFLFFESDYFFQCYFCFFYLFLPLFLFFLMSLFFSLSQISGDSLMSVYVKMWSTKKLTDVRMLGSEFIIKSWVNCYRYFLLHRLISSERNPITLCLSISMAGGPGPKGEARVLYIRM